ncbi:MAG: malonate transporter MadM subunit [Woeseiaceae bacterium]|jgi:malonate transporter MadM subunit
MLKEAIFSALSNNSIITAFLFVGVVTALSYWISNHMTNGKIHGSAIAITIGLFLAYIGGYVSEGDKGLADISIFTGVGILGGAMFRDFAIVATAFGVDLRHLKNAGMIGAISIIFGVILSFIIGAIVALMFGYDDAVSITTIGAGAATYIVGPVTGTALSASSEVIALSVAVGLIKSILVMIMTPFIAPYIKLDNAESAMIFGGLMGTTSGVAGGLAATDPELVPYGAMTATFYTGVGCLLAPSILFLIVNTLIN